jgi:hypothetical protein
MTTLQERIGNERRRLRNVRQRMLAAIERKAGEDDSFVSFYVAAADYIDTTMARLHGQDVRMGNMIKDKVEKVDAGVEQALAELDQRLAGATAQLKPFLAARDGLKEEGKAALEGFEKAGKAYSDFIVSTMGHHNATADLSAKLFSLQDWEYMARMTDDEIALEEELYQGVLSTTPEGVEISAD